MSFEKTVFVDGQTVIDANFLNALQDELIALRTDYWKTVYPVGAIYMSTSNKDPSALFGGTWESWGSGRVPVGVNSDDTDFSTANKTGGSKELQAHNHSTPNHTHSISLASTGSHSHDMKYNLTALGSGGTGRRIMSANGSDGSSSTTSAGSHTHTVNQTSSGGGTTGSTGSGTSGNMPPYITCYMFRRTA